MAQEEKVYNEKMESLKEDEVTKSNIKTDSKWRQIPVMNLIFSKEIVLATCLFLLSGIWKLSQNQLFQNPSKKRKFVDITSKFTECI